MSCQWATKALIRDIERGKWFVLLRSCQSLLAANLQTEGRSLILLQKEFSQVNKLCVVFINGHIRAIVQNNTWKRADSFLLIYNIVADPVHAVLKGKNK